MPCHARCGSGAVRCRALVHASCAADAGRRDTLARLVEQAWPVVRALGRRTGAKDEDVDDLTQSYFARFVEKGYLRRLETWEGCIRPFLLTSLRHFLSNARDHSRALKRGGRRRTVSLEEVLASRRPLPALVCTTTPESLLDSAARLADEARGDDQWRRLGTLLSRLAGHATDADIARQWGVRPVAVRVAAHRLRRRLAGPLQAGTTRARRDPLKL
jgi:DNA-directed RNA polymerase specialized sigma24 family protein